MAQSYSQIQLYRRCPRQYEFACIKKLPRQITAGESFGSSVHNTLKKWGELEMGTQGNGELEQQSLFAEDANTHDEPAFTLEALEHLWHQSFIVEGYESRMAADFARKRGEQLMQRFYNWWGAEQREVLAVEKGFNIDVAGTAFAGRFDRVEAAEQGVHVIDFKTGAPRGPEEVDADLQLSLYALAAPTVFDLPCTKLTLLYLSEDQVIERNTERSAGQLKDAETQMSSIIDRIDKRDFHPTPSVDACRCCPYKGVCDASAV